MDEYNDNAGCAARPATSTFFDQNDSINLTKQGIEK